jgi:hypothetical protein
VKTSLLLEDGSTIQLEGRPDQGTGNEVLYGTVLGSGLRIVVKLERTLGALEREAAALTAVGPACRIAPRLLLASFAEVSGERVPCLVIERCLGSPPTTIDGWWRMGRALGRLANVPPPAAGLAVLDTIAFGQRHAQRVVELGDRLDPFTDAIPDWHTLACANVPGGAPLVITHGDPGPGNYLDNGNDGVLIDWEAAHIAPQGLDLARLQFIAILGAGPSGYVARDQRARADAATDGYLRALPRPMNPSYEAARWWTAVAAIQFVHRRWQLGGHPAPWEEAARALVATLASEGPTRRQWRR